MAVSASLGRHHIDFVPSDGLRGACHRARIGATHWLWFAEEPEPKANLACAGNQPVVAFLLQHYLVLRGCYLKLQSLRELPFMKYLLSASADFFALSS